MFTTSYLLMPTPLSSPIASAAPADAASSSDAATSANNDNGNDQTFNKPQSLLSMALLSPRQERIVVRRLKSPSSPSFRQSRRGTGTTKTQSVSLTSSASSSYSYSSDDHDDDRNDDDQDQDNVDDYLEDRDDTLQNHNGTLPETLTSEIKDSLESELVSELESKLKLPASELVSELESKLELQFELPGSELVSELESKLELELPASASTLSTSPSSCSSSSSYSESSSLSSSSSSSSSSSCSSSSSSSSSSSASGTLLSVSSSTSSTSSFGTTETDYDDDDYDDDYDEQNGENLLSFESSGSLDDNHDDDPDTETEVVETDDDDDGDEDEEDDLDSKKIQMMHQQQLASIDDSDDDDYDDDDDDDDDDTDFDYSKILDELDDFGDDSLLMLLKAGSSISVSTSAESADDDLFGDLDTTKLDNDNDNMALAELLLSSSASESSSSSGYTSSSSLSGLRRSLSNASSSSSMSTTFKQQIIGLEHTLDDLMRLIRRDVQDDTVNNDNKYASNEVGQNDDGDSINVAVVDAIDSHSNSTRAVATESNTCSIIESPQNIFNSDNLDDDDTGRKGTGTIILSRSSKKIDVKDVQTTLPSMSHKLSKSSPSRNIWEDIMATANGFDIPPDDDNYADGAHEIAENKVKLVTPLTTAAVPGPPVTIATSGSSCSSGSSSSTTSFGIPAPPQMIHYQVFDDTSIDNHNKNEGIDGDVDEYKVVRSGTQDAETNILIESGSSNHNLNDNQTHQVDRDAMTALKKEMYDDNESKTVPIASPLKTRSSNSKNSNSENENIGDVGVTDATPYTGTLTATITVDEILNETVSDEYDYQDEYVNDWHGEENEEKVEEGVVDEQPLSPMTTDPRSLRCCIPYLKVPVETEEAETGIIAQMRSFEDIWSDLNSQLVPVKSILRRGDWRAENTDAPTVVELESGDNAITGRRIRWPVNDCDLTHVHEIEANGKSRKLPPRSKTSTVVPVPVSQN